MKNFPILEAAASHIEINGQMYEFPVYLKSALGSIHMKIISQKLGVYISLNERVAIIDFSMEYHAFNISTKQEFDRAFQDTFFYIAKLSEGNV